MENQFNRNKLIGIAIGVIAFFTTSYLVQNLLFKQPKFEDNLAKIANEVNKTCPKMIDQDTRLDNVVAHSNNKFQYNYTLVNLSAETVDTIKFHQLVDANIINNVKSNPDLKIYRDNKTTIGYLYKDFSGNYLMRISVTPEMYQ